MGENQIAQVRGYADQSLRNKNDPEDPANRRISVIVQYLEGDAPKLAPEKADAAIEKKEEEEKKEEKKD